MARYASRVRAAQVVITIDVALRTLQSRVCPGKCESCSRVIESCAAPIRRAVAGCARCGHVGLSMVRIRRPLVILKVTADAGRIRKIEIVVRMTLRASERGVSASQGEPNQAVIESRRLPSQSGVARLAGLLQAERDVIRVCRPLVVL